MAPQLLPSQAVNGKQKILLTAGGLAAGLTVRQLWAKKRGADLKGQIVLITGGAKGLGIALARRFAKEGCKLAICARNLEELHSVKRGLERNGAQVISVACDISDESQVKRMIAEVEAHYGRIDILVNNSGKILARYDFNSAMDSIFWGAAFPSLAVIPAMVNRKSGKIVTITPEGGKVTDPETVPSTCAKYATTGFSEGLHTDLRAEGVQVTTVAPNSSSNGSAAKKIVTAVKRGEPEKIATGDTKGLFPGVLADLLGLAATTILPKLMGPSDSLSPTNKVLLSLGQAAVARLRQRHA